MNSPSTPNSWIGRTLGDNNRYRLDKLLGRGGMGDVFLAMDTRINKPVALKILKDRLASSNDIRRRFGREIEICVALKSENIVRVTDKGFTSEGYPFYVMDYLEGQSLRQLLVRQKRLSSERTINIMMQVCNGLQHAHKGVYIPRQGATERIQVIHRDLKPDNIFLENIDFKEVVKIVDFGIAKIRHESSEQTDFTGAFLGTFRYASPEQLMGVINIDQRSDIYSLGIILYEMLSGADPFGFNINARNPSEASWIFAHTSEPAKPLRTQPGCEDLPEQLEEAVMRCLKKKPNERFASVEELNTALHAVLVFIQNNLSVKTVPRPINPPEKPQYKKSLFDKLKKFLDEKIAEKIKNPSSRLVITISMLASGCVTILFAYNFVTSRQVLEKIQQEQHKLNYEKCIALSEKVTSDSIIYLKVQEILNQCRRAYAINLAKENKCSQAYKVNEKIPKTPENHFNQIKTQIDNMCEW